MLLIDEYSYTNVFSQLMNNTKPSSSICWYVSKNEEDEEEYQINQIPRSALGVVYGKCFANQVGQTTHTENNSMFPIYTESWQESVSWLCKDTYMGGGIAMEDHYGNHARKEFQMMRREACRGCADSNKRILTCVQMMVRMRVSRRCVEKRTSQRPYLYRNGFDQTLACQKSG